VPSLAEKRVAVFRSGAPNLPSSDLAYLLADISTNCTEWNDGTVLLTAVGWAALLYRIRAEERRRAQKAGGTAYVRAVHFRLLPGLW
jgi:protein-S-isoprenylcysteine O-methyltransferase Ste14